MEERDWVCCFCGESVSWAEGLRLIVWTQGTEGKEQQFLAHTQCFVEGLSFSAAGSLSPELFGT